MPLESFQTTGILNCSLNVLASKQVPLEWFKDNMAVVQVLNTSRARDPILASHARNFG